MDILCRLYPLTGDTTQPGFFLCDIRRAALCCIPRQKKELNTCDGGQKDVEVFGIIYKEPAQVDQIESPEVGDPLYENMRNRTEIGSINYLVCAVSIHIYCLLKIHFIAKRVAAFCDWEPVAGAPKHVTGVETNHSNQVIKKPPLPSVHTY